MEYSVICPSCIDAITIESRNFEIAYPLDYENRIRKFLSNNCRKCREEINMKWVAANPGNPIVE
jgi:hypothetical protein